MILDSLHRSGYVLQQGDVLVIAQKIVSKSENRYAYLKDVRVSQEALDLAEKVDKDPRLVQLILDESVEVIRHRPGVVIVEHRLGYVHANAGIDQSNIFSELDSPRVLLLPTDADQSAARLREEFFASSGAEISVIINDSAGRAWRNGTLGFAIGTAGFEPVVDMVGETDLFGRPLETTSVAVGDELAAAASFLMGQADESVPVVLIRGAKLRKSEHGSGSLVREKSQDLFR
ncbi:coenzyme F420-0:L-glutamate ligase [Biformimicrobium ophioploci]|uniref:Coenzyme F420-0:L-glutamate ligase n=2 Tax=Biformimicrobium ophioploci TaxID=3036711 RepID=A0ABQ6M1Z3_9GAMM|nr:coenzyme F420-0:L-glutamate ligase [Microbulbifer sp. NKW57]